MKTNGGTDWGHDASQIPAEWHGWLHHMSDPNPVETKPLGQELADYGAAAPVAYEIKHIKNPTGSEDKYLPPWHRMSKSVRLATSVRTLVARPGQVLMTFWPLVAQYAGQAKRKIEAWVPPGAK
jgi:hypothetical protein